MVEGKSWMLNREWIHTLYLDAYFEDALTKMKAATGLGSTFALFTALNEYFHEWGYLDDKGYLYHKKKYARPLIEDLENRLGIEEESKQLEIRKKKLELRKLGAKKRPSYRKLPYEELEKLYSLAKTQSDNTTIQLIAHEFKRRAKETV